MVQLADPPLHNEMVSNLDNLAERHPKPCPKDTKWSEQQLLSHLMHGYATSAWQANGLVREKLATTTIMVAGRNGPLEPLRPAPTCRTDRGQPPEQANILFVGGYRVYGPQKCSNVAAMHHRHNKQAFWGP